MASAVKITAGSVMIRGGRFRRMASVVKIRHMEMYLLCRIWLLALLDYGVQQMQEVAGERGGYLHGQGALDSDDLLYLKEQMEAEEDAERLRRRTEKRAFTAFKKAAILADSTATVPVALRAEPKPKSDIRQQDILKKIVGIKPKRAKISSSSQPAESNTPKHDRENAVTKQSSSQNQSVPLSGENGSSHGCQC